MTDKRLQRNYEADFLKFVLCIFVILEHSTGISNAMPDLNYFKLATQISVPLFFSISGYLFASSIYGCKSQMSPGNCGKESLRYVLNRIGKLYPDYLFAIIIALISHMIVFWNQHSAGLAQVIKEGATRFLYIIPEVLLIRCSGVGNWFINGPTWYISAMLIVMLVLAYFMLKNKDTFLHVVCPLLFILVLGYRYQIYEVYGDSFSKFSGIFMIAILRAITGLCGGCIAFCITRKIKEYKWTTCGRFIFTVIYLVFITLGVVYGFFLKNDKNIKFVLEILFVPFVAILFSGMSFTSEIFKNRIFSLFSKLSLPIYLNHWTIRRFITAFAKDNNYWNNLALFIVGSLLLAVTEYFLLRLIMHISKKIPFKLIDGKNNYEC